jgi:asparagine synthase (glutamine-hydrolysing)
MSLFYGVYNESGIDDSNKLIDVTLPLTPQISSHAFIYRNISAISYDIGAYNDEGYYEESDIGFCILSGNPLLSDCANPADRIQQIQKIFKSTINGDWSLLSNCRGQFSMAIYNKINNSLRLIADSNGSRPLYYCHRDNGLYFGTNLDAVAEIAKVHREVDWEGETQKLVFGCPLGDRTVNRQIKVLRNGEMLLLGLGFPRCHQYFRWDDLPDIDMNSKTFGSILYDKFIDAITIRAQLCKMALSTLSGGLDSRCVVAALKHIGKDIIAFNISIPGEKDVIYARAYANAIKLNLLEIKRPNINWTWGNLIANAIKETNNEVCALGHLVFSGDGGSVGLGRVYLEAQDLECLSDNGESALARHFISDKRRMPPISYLIPQKGQEILDSLIESMRRELNDINCSDPVKKLFLFFLQNDQRRHLHQHYENILTHKIELLVPFMDKFFYELVISSPSSMFLYHTFYHDWLSFFPDTTRSVPWQTYPGHKECPVIVNDIDAIDQWSAYRNVKWNKKCLLESAELIRFGLSSGGSLRAKEVRQLRLFAACLAHAFGIGSYGYLLNFMRVLRNS